MFSTSIGLVLKGFEYMKNNHVSKQHDDENVFVTVDKEEDIDEKTDSKKNLFEKFKSTLNEIFAENDMKLE